MLILGLDPGSRHTGYGVVRSHGGQLKAIAYGRLTCPARAPVPERLARLADELATKVDELAPDVVVLETVFHGPNARSLIVLAQARGALLATLGRRGLEICEYSPAEVKQAVTGNGRADKQQVARMVQLLLGLGDIRVSNDATDALAVAICCANRWRMDRLASGR